MTSSGNTSTASRPPSPEPSQIQLRQTLTPAHTDQDQGATPVQTQPGNNHINVAPTLAKPGSKAGGNPKIGQAAVNIGIVSYPDCYAILHSSPQFKFEK